MALDLPDLDDRTRRFMLDELEADLTLEWIAPTEARDTTRGRWTEHCISAAGRAVSRSAQGD